MLSNILARACWVPESGRKGSSKALRRDAQAELLGRRGGEDFGQTVVSADRGRIRQLGAEGFDFALGVGQGLAGAFALVGKLLHFGFKIDDLAALLGQLSDERELLLG